MTEPKVIIIGAGGVGFWVDSALSRAGIPTTVYDVDTLEGGLGYSRVPKASPSTKKTTLLRGFTVAVMGDKPPVVVEALFTGKECAAGDLVVDCSDMPISARRGIWAEAKGRGARLLRVSYDGKNGTVAIAEGLPLGGKAAGGYADVPNLALSYMAGGMGALVVMSILKGEATRHIEFQVAMADYLTPPSEADTIEFASPEETKKAIEAPKRRRRKVADA